MKIMYNGEIERFNKECPKLHISKALRIIGKNNGDIAGVFGWLREKNFSKIVDEDYFPSTIEKLENRHFEYDPSCDMSIYYLLKWGSGLIEYYSKKINK